MLKINSSVVLAKHNFTHMFDLQGDEDSRDKAPGKVFERLMLNSENSEIK